MFTLLFTLSAICLLVAAAIHVFIFYLESIAWLTPRARRVFGLSPEQAEQTRQMAFNQGFYNLFLAVIVVVGVITSWMPVGYGGLALSAAGGLAMVGAGVVLALSDSSQRRPALIQAGPPALGLLLLAISLFVAPALFTSTY